MVRIHRRIALFAAAAAMLIPLGAAPAVATGAGVGVACKARLTTATSGQARLYCGTNPKASARAATPLVWKAQASCFASITAYNATRASVTTSIGQLAELKRKIATLPKAKQTAPLAQLKTIAANLKALQATLDATRVRLLSTCA